MRDARTLSEVLKSAEVTLTLSPTLSRSPSLTDTHTHTDTQVEKASLAPEEVVALRLLTGPMHEVYNVSLQGGGGGAKDKVGGSGGKGLRFATTCLLISSGLCPLAPPRTQTPEIVAVFSRARRLCCPYQFDCILQHLVYNHVKLRE